MATGMVAPERESTDTNGSASLSPPRISAVVLTRDAHQGLGPCACSILAQEPPVDELISSQAGAAARNAAAAEASGDVLAFVDADAEVQPGWAAGLARRFSLGATLVAGGIETRDGRTRVRRGRRWAADRHDLRGENGFLPIASGSNLAIRRDVFTQLGGFDPVLSGAEDLDLSFRAQLAGHHLTAAPEAVVALPRRALGRTLRDDLHRARAGVALRLKYSYFVFHDALAAAGTPSTGGLPMGALTLPARFARAGPGPAGLPLLTAAAGAARSIGQALGWLELISGWRGVPAAVQPANGAQELTAVALPTAPSLLLIGEDRLAVSLLAALANLVPELAVAPAGLIEAGRPHWEEQAPWSMRLARSARAHGWDIPVELAAKRLERERPRTWLEACLTLNAVHAWLCGRPRFAVAVTGRAGLELVRRLPETPVVVTGAFAGGPSRPALRLEPGRLLLRPDWALSRLEELIDEAAAGGGPARGPTRAEPDRAAVQAGSRR